MNNKREDRAARAEQMRKERERHERRQRNVISVVFVIVVIALIAGVAVWYMQNKPEEGSYADAPSERVAPENVTDDYGVDITAEDFGDEVNDDAPRVVAYEDFQCPACQQFESETGDQLLELARNGDIELEYRVITFLDRASKEEYSSRAANAAVCVLEDSDIEGFIGMHQLLYQNQPEENTKGLSDEKLTELAEQAGDDDAGSCIDGRRYDGWLQDSTKAADDNDIDSTPALLVDGEKVEDPTPEKLQEAIKAASE